MSSAIKRLVDAAIPEFYPALSILFVSAGGIQSINALGKKIPIVIELRGDASEAREAISLARHKLSRRLQPLLLEARRRAQVMLFEALPQSIKRISSELRKAEWTRIQSEMALRVATSQIIPLSDLTITEGEVAELLNHFVDKYEQQPSTLKNNDAIRLLAEPKIRLIEPRIQIGVCPECHIFELIASTRTKRKPECALCHSPQVAIRIYTFDDLYFKHKARSKDLPLFIKEYLFQLLPKIKIRNFKKIRPTIDGEIQEGDVDVYIQETQTGFECKNFLNPTPAESQMRNYVDEVSGELRKYLCAGVKRIILVTNLSEKDAQSMRKKVLLKLEEKSLSPDHFEVLPDSIQRLLLFLESEAKHVNLYSS